MQCPRKLFKINNLEIRVGGGGLARNRTEVHGFAVRYACNQNKGLGRMCCNRVATGAINLAESELSGDNKLGSLPALRAMCP